MESVRIDNLNLSREGDKKHISEREREAVWKSVCEKECVCVWRRVTDKESERNSVSKNVRVWAWVWVWVKEEK